MSKKLEDLVPGDAIVRVMPGFQHGKLFRNDGTVSEIGNGRITCEVLVDQYRSMVFDLRTGISTLGAEYGWLEIPGSMVQGVGHVPFTRQDVVKFLWRAKRAFENNSGSQQRCILETLIDGIQGMTCPRPTDGPLYERMLLLMTLYEAKAHKGAMNDLPDIFLDYMTVV